MLPEKQSMRLALRNAAVIDSSSSAMASARASRLYNNMPRIVNDLL